MHRMGRFTCVAGVAMILALAVSSCDRERSVDDPVRPEVVGNPLAFVGEMHNQALGHVLTRLQQGSQRAPLTRARALSIAEEGLDEFFARALDRPVSTGAEVDAWRRRLAREPAATAVELGVWVRGIAPADDAVELSARADEYVDRILRLTDEASSVEVLTAKLTALEEEAAGELSGDDLDAVYATSAVAASSAEYWDLHYDEWVALCADNPHYCETADGASGDVVLPALSRGWKVLLADVAGAAGGFLRGGWVFATIGAGVSSTVAVIMTT